MLPPIHTVERESDSISSLQVICGITTRLSASFHRSLQPICKYKFRFAGCSMSRLKPGVSGRSIPRAKTALWIFQWGKVWNLLLNLEREIWIEPPTFSLGRRQSIGNKEHSVSCISFWR